MISLIDLAEKGLIPDWMIRKGIQRLCVQRLNDYTSRSDLELDQEQIEYFENLKRQPVAIETAKANEQHYEVPANFFQLSLGKNLKYSSAYYDSPTTSLDEAEDAALAMTMERAELQDGMKILELGCGWGSLTLAMARKFPNSKITAISNSGSQKTFIESRALNEKLQNVQILTADVSKLESLPGGPYDRVVSVEMFEHMKNYEQLLRRVSDALKESGKLFVHIFTHKDFSYPFEVEGEDNWMGRYFFTGGQMPAHDLLLKFQRDLLIERQWRWSGMHYSRTARHWLEKMDENRPSILPQFQVTYGKEANLWFQRWRMFYMACEVLFGYQKGTQWGVSHYLFQKRR